MEGCLCVKVERARDRDKPQMGECLMGMYSAAITIEARTVKFRLVAERGGVLVPNSPKVRLSGSGRCDWADPI